MGVFGILTGGHRQLKKPGFLTTLAGLVFNTFLCVLKLSFGLWTSSLSLLSDGVNSLTDAVSSTAILIAVNVSHKEADENHPFGHHRAEPIAALIVAIFAGIAGFEILKASVERLFAEEVAEIVGPWPFVVLLISILVKTGMSAGFSLIGRRLNSPAILAGAADSKIDVLISSAAFVGVGGAYLGYRIVDPLVALIISLFIFRTGYKIGNENIDYLMGRSPSPERLAEIQNIVEKIPGVRGVDRLRAHYVGNYIHVELEIRANALMSNIASHDLEEKVRDRVEEIAWIDQAFVHINPALPVG